MLSLERAVALAEDVVAERGAAFTYRKPGDDILGPCLYVKADDERLGFTPAELEDALSGSRVTPCLVGSIIEKAGLMTDRIATSHDEIGVLISTGALGQGITHPVKCFLTTLQLEQDGGETWGDALAAAKATIEEIKL